MSEPTIICPNCKTEIKLTESLAAPLIESTRRDYEKRLALKDTDIAQKEESLREREEAVYKAKASRKNNITTFSFVSARPHSSSRHDTCPTSGCVRPALRH